jgi:plastocyanin
MKRRWLSFSALALLALGIPAAHAVDPPLPDPNFAKTLTPSPCTADAGNAYEQAQYAAEGWDPTLGRYPGVCQRLHFKFGPIAVKPGQNDVLIQPITIEKPAYDGYMTRIKPDLVRADGSIPPIEEVHLHHGTWLNFTKSYGSGPFFASGEEKTIEDLPSGFGFPIAGSDTWQLLYMVHNLTSRPDAVWITYDVDYIATSDAQALGMKAAYPIWLDVFNGSSYPVFNVQRSFATDGKCTWPAHQCAAFDPWGKISLGQGAPGNNLGNDDFSFPSAGGSLGQMKNFTGATIIGVGGHLHPGGLTTDLDIKRGDAVQRIFTSTANYWQWNNPPVGGGIPGGPPTSWDLSMTVTGLPRWAIHANPGDTLIINATYDATIQSTYENMGIMVAMVSPDVDGAPAVPNAINPFALTNPVDVSDDCASGGIATNTLCTKGVVTHGHMAEANNHGGNAITPITAGNMSSHTDHVAIADFQYAPGDFGTINVTGIPTVTQGSTLTFANVDSALDIYHTVTSCANPCTGSTGIAYPLADAMKSGIAALDFDSAELGFGPPIGPAKNAATWDLHIDPAEFQSGGVYTYFCRIHPSMRGAFAVE